MSAGLQLRGVSSGYGPTRIVHDVQLCLPPGSGLALLGRNGAGKTTLVGTIAGRVRQQAGTVLFDGNDITSLSPSARCRAGIGLVPQDRQAFRTLTVEENLAVADLARGWTNDRVYALFPRLAERRRHSAGQLSGGEQQMLAIGRALMSGPRCLLLDEPFEGLAPVLIEGLLAALHRLRAETGIALLVVEQNASLALELAEAGFVLERGRVRLRGTKKELQSRLQEVEALLSFDPG
jgi:branched-chain amino acid transport system ATP-binding protein